MVWCVLGWFGVFPRSAFCAVELKMPQSSLTSHTVKINKFNYFKYWSYFLLTFYTFGNAEMELFRQLLEK